PIKGRHEHHQLSGLRDTAVATVDSILRKPDRSLGMSHGHPVHGCAAGRPNWTAAGEIRLHSSAIPLLRKKMSRVRPLSSVFTALCRALLPAICCYVLSSFAGHGCAQAAPRPITPRGPLMPEERSNIAVFESSKASVVYISTSERVLNYWTRRVQTVSQGTGSGFIWDSAGHIVTNLHVIEDASVATVRLADGKDYPATLIGVSRTHDIAVLQIRIPTSSAIAIPIGTSHDLQVGQKVYAIGNPFGLDWTLTTGIVSALDRSLTGENGVLIQH